MTGQTFSGGTPCRGLRTTPAGASVSAVCASMKEWVRPMLRATITPRPRIMSTISGTLASDPAWAGDVFATDSAFSSCSVSFYANLDSCDTCHPRMLFDPNRSTEASLQFQSVIAGAEKAKKPKQGDNKAAKPVGQAQRSPNSLGLWAWA